MVTYIAQDPSGPVGTRVDDKDPYPFRLQHNNNNNNNNNKLAGNIATSTMANICTFTVHLYWTKNNNTLPGLQNNVAVPPPPPPPPPPPQTFCSVLIGFTTTIHRKPSCYVSIGVTHQQISSPEPARHCGDHSFPEVYVIVLQLLKQSSGHLYRGE